MSASVMTSYFAITRIGARMRRALQPQGGHCAPIATIAWPPLLAQSPETLASRLLSSIPDEVNRERHRQPTAMLDSLST